MCLLDSRRQRRRRPKTNDEATIAPAEANAQECVPEGFFGAFFFPFLPSVGIHYFLPQDPHPSTIFLSYFHHTDLHPVQKGMCVRTVIYPQESFHVYTDIPPMFLRETRLPVLQQYSHLVRPEKLDGGGSERGERDGHLHASIHPSIHPSIQQLLSSV